MINLLSFLCLLTLSFLSFTGRGALEYEKLILQPYELVDTCQLCSGRVELYLVEKAGDSTIKGKINKLLLDSLSSYFNGYYGGDETFEIEDFQEKEYFPKNHYCLGAVINSEINLNNEYILSITLSGFLTCGSGTNAIIDEQHLNINVNTGSVMQLNDIISASKIEKFSSYVSKYAKKRKIDNIPYYSDDEFKHSQSKLTYLNNLNSKFSIQDGKIILYTLVHDKNTDYFRKSSVDSDVYLEIGKAYMKVEVPLIKIKSFIKQDSPLSIYTNNETGSNKQLP